MKRKNLALSSLHCSQHPKIVAVFTKLMCNKRGKVKKLKLFFFLYIAWVTLWLCDKFRKRNIKNTKHLTK